MHTPAIMVMLSFALGAILFSWLYFQRYRINRPPIGVINLFDVAVLMVGIVLVPYLYLWLPAWLVVGLLLLGAASLLSLLLEPLLSSRLIMWVVTVTLLIADLAAAYFWTTQSRGFLLINNGVMLLLIIAITNLWAQSGMKARDAALLGGALIVYDGVSTAILPLMGDLFARMMHLPLGTQLAWPIGETGFLAAIGMGDVLLAAVFPLVMHKAFGRRAGLIAAGSAGVVLVVLPFLPFNHIFPVMVVLGPLMIVQYLYWRWRDGSERTTWQYLQAEPARWLIRSQLSME